MAVFSKFAVSVVAVAVGYEEEHCETASAIQMMAGLSPAVADLSQALAGLSQATNEGPNSVPIMEGGQLDIGQQAGLSEANHANHAYQINPSRFLANDENVKVSKEVSKEVQDQICSALKEEKQLEEAKSLLETGSADGKLLTRLKEALPDASADNLAKVAELLAGLDVGKFEETWNICRDAAIADARFDALYQDLIIKDLTPNKGSEVARGVTIGIVILLVLACACFCGLCVGDPVHCALRPGAAADGGRTGCCCRWTLVRDALDRN